MDAGSTLTRETWVGFWEGWGDRLKGGGGVLKLGLFGFWAQVLRKSWKTFRLLWV